MVYRISPLRLCIAYLLMPKTVAKLTPNGTIRKSLLTTRVNKTEIKVSESAIAIAIEYCWNII